MPDINPSCPAQLHLSDFPLSLYRLVAPHHFAVAHTKKKKKNVDNDEATFGKLSVLWRVKDASHGGQSDERVQYASYLATLRNVTHSRKAHRGRIIMRSLLRRFDAFLGILFAEGPKKKVSCKRRGKEKRRGEERE
jgi:hypothetical protein